jgi:hypothetical protein
MPKTPFARRRRGSAGRRRRRRARQSAGRVRGAGRPAWLAGANCEGSGRAVPFMTHEPLQGSRQPGCRTSCHGGGASRRFPIECRALSALAAGSGTEERHGCVSGSDSRAWPTVRPVEYHGFLDRPSQSVTMSAACTHLTSIAVARLDRVDGCQECLELGDTWVHLRQCLQCGHVGCCDSSRNRHATAHFRATAHPLVTSLERGERWIWCFVDQVLIEAPTANFQKPR